MKNPNFMVHSIVILSFALIVCNVSHNEAIQAKNIDIQEAMTRILSEKNFADSAIEINYTYCTGDLPYPGCSRRYVLCLRLTNATYRMYIYDPHQARSFVSYESMYRISDDQFRSLLRAFIETGFFNKETEKGVPESIPGSDRRTISIAVNGACFRRQFNESVDRDRKNLVLRTSKRVKNWQKYDLNLEEIDGIPPELNPLEYLIDKITEKSPVFMIHKLIETGDVSSVIDCINKNPLLIDARNDEGDTPLHKFAATGNEKMVEFLLDKGAIVDARDFIYDETPLHLATFEGRLQVVKLLVEKGASVKAKNSEGLTPLHFASIRGHIDVVKFLMNKGAEIDARDNDNSSPLLDAASNGHLEVVRLLFSKGADVNARTKKFGWTALQKAAESGHEEVVEFLLSNGADVNMKDTEGFAVLHDAARNGHNNVIDVLLSYGADVNVKDTKGFTALHNAARNRRDEVLQHLLSKNADPNVEDNAGMTPLHWISSLKGAKILLQYGACINMRDIYGRTPLHYAVKRTPKWTVNRDFIDLVKLFVDEGADTNAVDIDGKTLLRIAIEEDLTDIVDLLRKYGAKE